MNEEKEYDDQGREILPPVVYEMLGPSWRDGLRLSDEDREIVRRMEQQRSAGSGAYTKSESAVNAGDARPVQELVIELGSYFDLDPFLEADFRRCYDLDPLKVTKIAERVLTGCKEQVFHSPGGFLRSRLKAMGTSG